MRTAVYRDLFIRAIDDEDIALGMDPDYKGSQNPYVAIDSGTMVQVLSMRGDIIADVRLHPNPKWWVARYDQPSGLPPRRPAIVHDFSWGFDWYDTLTEALDSIADWRAGSPPVRIDDIPTEAIMSHDQLKEKAAPELDALFTFSPVSLVSGITIPVRMFYLIKEILTSGVEDEVGPGEAVWASMNTLCIMRHVESKNKITPTIWKHANAGPKN